MVEEYSSSIQHYSSVAVNKNCYSIPNQPKVKKKKEVINDNVDLESNVTMS